MAVIGLYSLRQDRLLAEQDARESGVSLARRLARDVGDEIEKQARDYRNANFSLQANRTAELGFSRWASNANMAQVQRQIDDWQRANPELNLTSLPVIDCGASLTGQFRPLEYPQPPKPPTWLTDLTDEQRNLWQSAQQAEFMASDKDTAQSAVDQFLKTTPPKGARVNAELILLRLKSAGLSAQDAADQCLASKLARSDDLSEAGLPIGHLVCLQGLRSMSNHAGLSDQFLRTLGGIINFCPSILSPRLIEEAERVAGPEGSESSDKVVAIHGWWEAEDAARHVLEIFREQYPPNSWTNRPYWVALGEKEFLLDVAFQKGPFTQPTPSGDIIVSNAPPVWDIHLYPREVLESGVARGIARADAWIPPYAKIIVEIGGKNLLSRGGQLQQSSKGLWPVLGNETGQISLPQRPMDVPGFPFRATVYLAKPEILYARQRQRTLMFGALILVSAIAATIGFFAARRAFFRQLRLNEMKSDFVSSVSHELRAPIASVRLMAEGLERGRIQEPAKQAEYFRFIGQECRRLSSLIENVLDFSRIEQGRKQYELESTDLVALTQQTVKLMETYAAERQIAIKLETSGAPVPIEADGKALQQALINLIDNALKHSPKCSAITVGLEFKEQSPPRSHQPSSAFGAASERGHVKIWVEDHGEGIPASEHEKIFERFYRVGSELRRETQGVGIGLSIVKHIVEAHGGRVIVRSAPGQGSRFTIDLPAAQSVI